MGRPMLFAPPLRIKATTACPILFRTNHVQYPHFKIEIQGNPATRDALDWLSEHRYGEALFMWPWHDKIGSVYDAFKKVCKAAQSKISASMI